MNDKRPEAATYSDNRFGKSRRDGECWTEEQFEQWLEQSLKELVANHSDFATTKSNRKYFSR